MTTAPTRGIIVCHLPHICRTLVPKICVRPMHSCVLTCSRAWFITACAQLNSKDDRNYSLPAKKISDKDRYMYLLHVHIHVGLVNAQTHGINWFSLWSCCCPATYQLTCLCESESTNGLTVLLFFDVHIDIGVTLNLLQCLCDIYGCRAVQTHVL